MAAWIGVASADHVARGIEGGFMQVCHGKRAPLARIMPGDRMIYYSPSTALRDGEKLQAFTAAGIVRQEEPYLFEMDSVLSPWRRNIDWQPAHHAGIGPLLERLDLTRGRTNWGYGFRFAIVRISDHDCRLILGAMGAPQVASE